MKKSELREKSVKDIADEGRSCRKYVRPSKKEPLIPFDTFLHGKYQLKEIIGAGGYGQILKAQWPEQKICIAIKIMTKKHEPKRMILEQRILRLLQNKDHFPYIFGSGNIDDNYVFIAMELLGRSLSDLRKKSDNKRFDASTSIQVGIQAFEALRILHDIDYIHRDIKPGNLCCGDTPTNCRTIYLIDFGLSRKFRENGRIVRRKTAGFRGTLRYVSLNVHDRKDQCPCDDLISLFYTIIELSEGMLPWTKLRDPDDIARKKKNCKSNDLCIQQPLSLFDFYTQCYDTSQGMEQIDYEELLNFLKNCLPDGNGSELYSYENQIAQDATGPTETTYGEDGA